MYIYIFDYTLTIKEVLAYKHLDKDILIAILSNQHPRYLHTHHNPLRGHLSGCYLKYKPL